LAFVLSWIASFHTPEANRVRAHFVPLGLAASTAATIAQLLGLTPVVT
jgi:hypothetical protein